MDHTAPMLPYPVYIGRGLSHGTVIPAQQIRQSLASAAPQSPSLAPSGTALPLLSSIPNSTLNVVSLQLNVCLFSTEGEQSISSPPQALLHLDALPSAPSFIKGCTLFINYTGHLILRTGGASYRSEAFTMNRNTWYRLSLVFDRSSLLLVLANDVVVIQVPPPSSTTSIDATPAGKLSTEASASPLNLLWPFGPLFLGNSGLTQEGTTGESTNWSESLCHGAISGVEVRLHSTSSLNALLETVPQLMACSSRSFGDEDIQRSGKLSAEQRGSLGTLQCVLEKSANLFSLPPDSFPLPSRTSRPLFEVTELDNWESYLDAFSALRLPSFKPTPLQPRKPAQGAKVLLCHDYRGGYFKDSAWERTTESEIAKTAATSALLSSNGLAQDSSLSSSNGTRSSQSPLQPNMHLTTFIPEVYTFQNWAYIDMFVYFSHARVTIPPTATIQAAHANGVEIYGTLIMEWDEGALATRRIVAGRNGDSLYYAKKLVEIAEKLGFEGWLVNIEHSMPLAQVDPLVAWVGSFKGLLNASNGKKLIWYDSVLNTGELKWQSALNDKNYRFFPVSDYFFTDYHWIPENLRISRLAAGDQVNRVLMGVDVWGRGSYGGGGWNTPAAIKEILTFNPPQSPPNVRAPSSSSRSPTSPSAILLKPSTPPIASSEIGPVKVIVEAPEGSPGFSADPKKTLGVAIFAPGWTLENQADSCDSLTRNEDRFWQGKGYWNALSKPFEKNIQQYFRQYLLNREDPTKFTAEDILGPFEYSADGAAGQAEKEAAKFSSTTPNAAGGRFPGIEELFDPRTAGSQWAWRHLRCDLTDAGSEITPEYMDTQPEITLSVWFKGNGPQVQDLFRLRVVLVSAANTCIAEFDSGTITCSGQWTQLRYVWRGYGPGVRSIMWVDGGKDAETWAGFYGCTIDRPTIWIPKPQPIESVGTYITPRQLQNSTLPFVSSFDVGQGTSLYSNGAALDYKLPNGALWYNLAAQSPMPTLQWSFDQYSHFHMPSDPTKAVIAMDKRSLSRQDLSLINYAHGNLVDASEVDGGVFHGSSCLKLEALISAPSDAAASKFISPKSTSSSSSTSIPSLAVPLSSSSSSSLSSSSSGLPASSGSVTSPRGPESDVTKATSDSISSVKRKRSSMKLLFESSKAQNPSEQATLSLYPLRIDSSETSIMLRIVFRPVRIPANAMVLAKVSRRKASGEVLESLSWDLLSKDHRDLDSQSSLGWTNFIVSWTCEADIIYDGVSLTLVALQHAPSGPAVSSSPRFTSPRSHVAINPFSHLSLSSSTAGPSSTSTTPTPEMNFVLLVGFLKIDQRSLPHLSSIPSPPSSNPLMLSTKQASPLGLSYKLTWSRESIFTEIPVWTLTAFWNTPAVPASLAHLGPPHFIVTATASTAQEDDAPILTQVLCQGRTWNPSWVIPGLVGSGDVIFTVSTVYPDYSLPSHLVEKITIAWPK